MESVNTKPKRKAPPKAFVPGQSGNPNGRPKKNMAMTEILRTFLEDQKLGAEKIDGKEAVIRKMFELAMTGDISAMRYIWERMDGPIKTVAEITGENGGPLIINIGKEFDKL